MKLASFYIVAALLIVTSCAPRDSYNPNAQADVPSSYVEYEYDEFQNTYNVTLSPSLAFDGIGEELRLGAISAVAGDATTQTLKNQQKAIWVTYTADDWAFIESAIFLIDGERLPLKGVSTNRDVFSGGTIYESVLFPVNKNVFRRIAEADAVRMRVAGEEITLSKALQNRFGAFYKRYIQTENEVTRENG